MHPLDYFEQIYVINLPQRHDRRSEMAEQLRMIGLTWNSPGIRLFSAVRPDDPGGFPSIGTKGCFLSHLGVLRDAAKHGFERILLFEDDLNFVSDFPQRMNKTSARLAQEDWSFFYGGYAIEPMPAASADTTIIPVNASETITTAHFVGFRGDVIEETIGFLEQVLSRPPGHPDGGPMHVDGAYAWYRHLHPEKLTLLATPQLGYQRSSRTDIHALRWYDRTPLVRSAVNYLRKRKNSGRSAV